MKTLLVVFFTLSIASSYAQYTELDSTVWKTNYAAAYSDAKENEKPMLMVFSGCDWCKPCIKLKEQILSTEEFSKWAKTHAVCLILDFPSSKKHALSKEQTEQNDMLAERYNPNGIFPLVLLIDNDENIIGNLGYEDISVAEYIAKIEEFLK